MKKREIRARSVQLTDSELRDRIEEMRELLHKTKMSHAVAPIENPLKIRAIRREIAMLLTEKRARELKNKNNK